jgi:RNA ligase (TIGR02306 family)
MSGFNATIYRIAVEEHPGADRLEIGRIPGQDYQFVVGKGQFAAGDLFVYIQEGSLVPAAILQEMGLTGKLAGPEANRVRAQKFRGILSQGLAYRPSAWLGHWTEGMDVAGELGIARWEPPIPLEMAGVARPAPGGTIFRAYTDIENHQRYPGVIAEGEPVAITEKLHGTCCLCGIFRTGGETEHRLVSSLGLAQRHLVLEESATNVYWRAAGAFDLFARLAGVMAELGVAQAMLFGEVLGTQDLKYAYANGHVGYMAFDLYTAAGFVTHGRFEELCRAHGIPMVPVLYTGPFDAGLLKSLADGPSTVGPHIREGAVVRPLAERDDPQIGRVILKRIGAAYLTRKGGTEAH